MPPTHRAPAWLLRALYYLLPNLVPFDIKAQVVHAEPVSWAYLGLTLGYGAAYVTMLLMAAVWIFTRRDFK